jgi:hypothetical protein
VAAKHTHSYLALRALCAQGGWPPRRGARLRDRGARQLGAIAQDPPEVANRHPRPQGRSQGHRGEVSSKWTLAHQQGLSLEGPQCIGQTTLCQPVRSRFGGVSFTGRLVVVAAVVAVVVVVVAVLVVCI